MQILMFIATILVVVLLFNFMIFFHELGHFLAAKWRGLVVDKFYIWFGKPIWKKTIGGVEYGLGSIPALPQMAPMEAIEGGDNERRNEMPPISPLDKIIVAAAGPFFSFLLALIAACVVTVIGKPSDSINSTTIGFVEPGSPAEQAGLQVGDQVLAIDGEPVALFLGGLDGMQEKIMMSRNKSIEFRVLRDGEEKVLSSSFKVGEREWFRRTAMRQVGIGWPMSMVVEDLTKESPAIWAGLQKGDRIVSAEGEKMWSASQFGEILKSKLNGQVTLEVERGEDLLELELLSMIPKDKESGDLHPAERPLAGILFATPFDLSLENPSPIQQIWMSVRLMGKTLQAIVAKDSSVGVQHLSGPVGIGTAMFQFLSTDYALNRIMWFMVVLNINLAIMNMLPFPVLDGGHIVLATGEWLAGKPVKLKLLEFVQYGFVFVLLGLFVFITSKDIGDLIPGKSPTRGEWVWEKPVS